MKSAALESPEERGQPDDNALRLMGNAKVMMVDDEPINMRVLQLHLKAEGYERFVTVSDSTTAMSVLRDEKPNVLLLDLNMPEVSGLDILEAIRSDSQFKQLPVIVLTSSNNPEMKFKALQLGANDFLSKPVHASELALRMRNTLIARAYEQQIMHVDALTNLHNRLYFVDLIARLSNKAEQRSYSRVLVLINLHRFKSINDSYGSARGDDVLWAFSQRLIAAFANSDVASPVFDDEHAAPLIMRLGGDRFGVFMDAGSQPEEDSHLKECIAELLRLLDEPFVVDSQDVYISVGIGVASLDNSSNSVETTINHAETAMNHSPGAPAPYQFYSVSMVAGARRALDIENGLRTAIIDGEIYLTYQPKVCVKTGVITGAEALLRWDHPQMGSISPVEFIPVAESSGQIILIGQWVLEQACEQAAVIRTSGFPEFKIAVNVSIPQLYESNFIDVVQRALLRSRLPADALTLELTENLILEDVDASCRKLTLLRELGVFVSIDDFGTGYSSLSYLQRFPVDQLKIDRSFIMQIESAETCAPVVKAIVTLAHDLSLSVVAEGVETAVQLEHIRRLSCGEYQGYFKSRPLMVDQFMELMLSGNERAA